jgi:hypothetical protein
MGADSKAHGFDRLVALQASRGCESLVATAQRKRGVLRSGSRHRSSEVKAPQELARVGTKYGICFGILCNVRLSVGNRSTLGE